MERLAVFVQVLMLILSASAFLGVIWPAIRQQQRMGRKIEDLLDSEDVRNTIRFYTGYSPRKET